MNFISSFLILGIAVGVGYWLFDAVQKRGDVLTAFTGEMSLTPAQLQMAGTAFCLSPLPGLLQQSLPREDTPFEPVDARVAGETKLVSEGDYTKDSIYSILYSLYRNLGKVDSPSGVKYQFTFNTWGFTDVPWILDESEPQRHGKAAYQGLVEFDAVKKYLETTESSKFIEIGSGTGAGGNLISSLVKGSHYTCLDMQRAAIDTCNELHAKHNPNLECQVVEGGVGNNGNKAPAPDGSTDVVVISETHIAEVDIGPEEEAIFEEIKRMLKPGGFFVWGNALPTHVWHKGSATLQKMGFIPCGERNHTAGAVKARQEDAKRVDMFVQSVSDYFPVGYVPYFGPRCESVTALLIKNFYRHPGTQLYEKMVVGYDSYMHLCFQKPA
jgi:SAM-dependent methyltransferase